MQYLLIMLKVREVTRINRENDIQEELEEDFDWNDPNFLFMIKDFNFQNIFNTHTYIRIENILKITYE